MLLDHHVSFRSEDTIAKRTTALRRYAGISDQTWFDVPNLIENYLSPFLGHRGPVKLSPFDKVGKDEHKAFVTFSPRTIHYHRPLWASARLGFPRFRLMLAHEIGHADLHDAGSMPFLRDPSKQLSFDEENTSAEWQAITYSYHLLMPNWALERYDGAQSLATACRVDLADAEERLRRHERKLKYQTAHYNDFCLLCGCLCDLDGARYCSSCTVT